MLFSSRCSSTIVKLLRPFLVELSTCLCAKVTLFAVFVTAYGSQLQPLLLLLFLHSLLLVACWSCSTIYMGVTALLRSSRELLTFLPPFKLSL
jgi:hypothetical protein